MPVETHFWSSTCKLRFVNISKGFRTVYVPPLQCLFSKPHHRVQPSSHTGKCFHQKLAKPLTTATYTERVGIEELMSTSLDKSTQQTTVNGISASINREVAMNKSEFFFSVDRKRVRLKIQGLGWSLRSHSYRSLSNVFWRVLCRIFI